MNEQERDVIADIFRRLEQVADQPRDPEAERFIAERLRQQPYAPYAMAQTIFVQEQALANLQAEADLLRAQLDETRRQPQQGGGLLSSLFGGGARQRPEPGEGSHDAEPVSREPRPSSAWGGPSVPRGGANAPGMRLGAPGRAGPWGGAPQAGGGFLQGALSTAAGVAGGVMLANVLTNAFSGKGVEAAGGDKGADPAADTAAADAAPEDAQITDSLYDQPAEQHDDFSDFGGDGGDMGDWA